MTAGQNELYSNPFIKKKITSMVNQGESIFKKNYLSQHTPEMLRVLF
jgi:hypothetical protein